MSASLVQKGLEIVDPECNKTSKRKNKSNVFKLTPDQLKLIEKTYKKGAKVNVNLLSCEKKLTVSEARKSIKSKEQILQENLKKLQLIQQASKVHLDEKLIEKLINRAVTRRPISKVNKDTEEKKTAFTEEDFKKFEEEYFE